jgi:glycosyltransferase involved in cell wall biosynthesis
MLPCFNAEETLPRALGSVAAQSMTDWDCVCVDDGSTDRTFEILSAAARRDPRFRVERFPENRGRGAARQRVLELVTGDFLAFQDADDWMYPDRLAHELRWLEADSKIAAVSACAAITNGPDVLVGVQRPKSGQPLPVVAAFERPEPPPIIFPTSMIRCELAKTTGFNPEFRRSQDSDFLVRALRGKHYALGSEVLYAYSQGSAASLERTFEGYRYRMRTHASHWRDHPVGVARTLAVTAAKIVAYRAVGLVGLEQKLIDRRWGEVDPDTARDFEIARAVVVISSQPFA